MNESNMASYFQEAGNLSGSCTGMCSEVAGPSNSGSRNLFGLLDREKKTDPDSLNRATHGWLPSWL